MNALKYSGTWHVDLIDSESLRCQSDEDVVVRVKTCGICGTDMGIITGDYPVAIAGVTLGHEAAGIIEQVGAGVTSVKPGDRVVIDPTYACGQCRMCQTGRPNHCRSKHGMESGVSYDGTFADFYRTSSRFVHKIPDDLSFAAASLTEPLSCAVTGVNKIRLPSVSARTVVIGAGPMGLLYYWALRIKGLIPFVIETNPARMQYARSILSNDTVFASLPEAMDALYSVKDGLLDVVVDTSGRMLDTVYPMLAPGGTFLSVGLKSHLSTINAIELADKSLSVIGSIDSVNGSFLEALHLIEKRVIPVEKLVSHNLPLQEYRKAFRLVGCDLDRGQLHPIAEPVNKVMLHM